MRARHTLYDAPALLRAVVTFAITLGCAVAIMALAFDILNHEGTILWLQ